MTNFERIKAMDIDELAEWLRAHVSCLAHIYNELERFSALDCVEGYKTWLKQEVKEMTRCEYIKTLSLRQTALYLAENDIYINDDPDDNEEWLEGMVQDDERVDSRLWGVLAANKSCSLYTEGWENHTHAIYGRKNKQLSVID